jgi:hypothetical protein
MTAPVSSGPWVRPSPTGTAAQTATIRQAASTDRSPAARGRCGLLTRSISMSVIWLTPTMATFTHAPASITQSRWSIPAPVRVATAIRYRPAALRNVPMSVCGRENRHRTPMAAGRRTAAARLVTGAPGGP